MLSMTWTRISMPYQLCRTHIFSTIITILVILVLQKVSRLVKCSTFSISFRPLCVRAFRKYGRSFRVHAKLPHLDGHVKQVVVTLGPAKKTTVKIKK